jgi:hypothetical protein
VTEQEILDELRRIRREVTGIGWLLCAFSAAVATFALVWLLTSEPPEPSSHTAPPPISIDI